jgi:hypothetical protein
MTKDDKRWLEDVASLGCIVCRNLGYGFTPAEIPHPQRAGHSPARRPQRNPPLCPTTEPAATAAIRRAKTWEENYGTETELLDQVTNEVKELRLCRI